MLKRKEIEHFLELVPPHPNMDALMVHTVFELLRTQPRTIGELAERLDKDWANTKRFMTKNLTYQGYFIFDDDTKEYSLSEDKIRHKLIGHDPVSGVQQLVKTHDKHSPGHEFDPIGPDWFTEKVPLFPCPPREFSEDSIRRYSREGNTYDPFFTMCYVFTCCREKFRARVINKFTDQVFEYNNVKPLPNGIAAYDVVTWTWAFTNMRRKNYTFFTRNFSYLPETYSQNAEEEYGLTDSVGFIRNWMTLGPQIAKGQ